MPVYDDQEERQSEGSQYDDDALRRITGINEEQEAAHEREARKGAKEDIAAQESQPGGTYANYTDAWNGKNTNSASLVAAEGLAAGGNFAFNARDKGDKKPNVRSWLSRNRKKTLAGGLISLLLGGSAFIGVPGLGAAQLIQLSHVLQHSNAKNDSDSSNRLGRLFRLARAAKGGDIGETRVNALGSKYFGSTINQLEDIGVEVDRSITGSPTRTTIDTDKLKASYPELEGMNSEETKSFLADKLGVTPDQISGSGTKFSIDQHSFSLKASRLLTKSTVGLLDDGKISAAIKTRILTKFFNLPSLFHPERALAAKENQFANTIDQRKAEQKAEQEREATLTEAPEAEAEIAVKDVDSNSRKFNNPAMSALLLTGGVCFVRSIAGDIVTINHDRVVVPSAIRAVDLMAVGAQVEAGQDIEASQMGIIADGFTDTNGQTIWSGEALQALANGNQAGEGYKEIPEDYKQAFSGNTTAATVKGWADEALGGHLLTAAACSKVGILAQILVALGASAASAFGEVASGGTLTPAIVGIWAAKESVSFAISAVAMHFVQSFVLNKTTASKLAEDAFSGPTGGNLLAYGARASANMVSIASGGIDLGANATSILAANEASQEQKQFESKSLFARMFDIYDYHSLAGHLADMISPSWSANIASFTASFTHLASVVPSVLGSLLPKAYAADGSSTYKWAIHDYGLPATLLNDPNLSDPYANADYVAKNLLDTNATGSYGMTYIARAQACFGDDITKSTDNLWDVIHEHDVDPSDSGYLSAHCNTLTDENWNRVIMFIFDTTDMKAAACYQGDQQSCSDEGAGGASADTTSTATAGNIDTSKLYQSSVDTPCAAGTTDLGNTTGYTQGNAVQIRLCAISSLPSSSEESTPGSKYYIAGANGDAIVNSIVSGPFLALVNAAKAAGIPMHANSSFRTMAHQQSLWNQDPNPVEVARPGTSNHQMGLAIDFTMDNTAKFNDSTSTCVNVSGRCEAPGDKVWEWLNTDAGNYGIKPYVNEYWHWSPTGN